MKTLFSYYGAKSKLASLYPPPEHDVIVEPFAGAANYSQLYADRKVVLCDLEDDVVAVWRYLIRVSEREIMDLPDEVPPGTEIRHPVPEARLLLAFNANQGSSYGKKIAGRFNGWNRRKKEFIASRIPKIRHWKVVQTDYRNLPNGAATWFVDPPYQFGGQYYRHNGIDFSALSAWCRDRQGQVIVCENSKADWLPFRPLKNIHGQLHKTTEVIYTQ